MVPLSEELAGQTALVSGSSRGIGKGIARALLQAGARVYLNGRDAAALTTCADELRTVTGRDSVQTLCADLTHTEVIARLAEQLHWTGPVHAISALSGAGCKQLAGAVMAELERREPREQEQEVGGSGNGP